MTKNEANLAAGYEQKVAALHREILHLRAEMTVLRLERDRLKRLWHDAELDAVEAEVINKLYAAAEPGQQGE